MPKGSPGARRGRRGPNTRKAPAKKATKRKAPAKKATKRKAPAKKATKRKAPTKKAAKLKTPTSNDRAARRELQIDAAMQTCRLKNPGVQGIAEDALRSMLRHEDYLTDKIKEDSITSEEGQVLNGVRRNTVKLLQAMGVDELRDADDCPACDGMGEVSRKPCPDCDGTGMCD